MIQAKLKQCAGCNQMKHIWKANGKDKYCKECWYSIEKPKSIPPISKKMKETVDQYTKIRTAYLVVNPSCKARLVGCTSVATDVHHKAGRGENHLRIATWLPVCRPCHTWIELHPIEAKELNLSETRL
jgi:hypothetical protein